MKKAFSYLPLALLLGLLLAAVIRSGGFYFSPPKGVFTEIPNKMAENRNAHVSNRTVEMSKAVDLISGVFRIALQKCAESKDATEIRFYPPKTPMHTTDNYFFGGDSVYNALQVFQINIDKTRFPLSDPITLPREIVCYTNGSSSMAFIDEKMNLMWMTIDSAFCARIVLYDTAIGLQIPLADRTIIIINNTIYSEVTEAESITGLQYFLTPGTFRADSFPINKQPPKFSP